MKTISGVVAATILLASILAVQPAPDAQGQGGAQAPPQAMGFFVTSVGMGKGGDLASISGADAHCQSLAQAAGAGNRTWHAYLSRSHRSNRLPGISARDRIGKGPWYNAKGVLIAKSVADLHGDNNLTKQTALTEKGEPVNGVDDKPNMHDVLTGSQPDGTLYLDEMDHTCNDWMSGGKGAQVGHTDRQGGGNTSWNSAHATKGCSQEDLVSTGGAGLFYCFAIN